MSWAEVKVKQAENIAKLYEKNPDLLEEEDAGN